MGMKSSATVCARSQNQPNSTQDCEPGDHDTHVQRFVQEYDRSDCCDDRHAELCDCCLHHRQAWQCSIPNRIPEPGCDCTRDDSQSNAPSAGVYGVSKDQDKDDGWKTAPEKALCVRRNWIGSFSAV